MAPPHFCLKCKKHGQARNIKDKEANCLTKDEARYIYKDVESENIVNVDTIKQEKEADKLGDDNNNLEEDVNLYHEIITNKVEKDDVLISEIEQWSILSNIVNYMHYNRHPKNFYDLDIKMVDEKGYRKIYGKEEKRQIHQRDFGDTPNKLKGEYLDVYKGIQSEVISATRFDENSDLSMTYLDRIDTTTASGIKADKTYSIYQNKGI